MSTDEARELWDPQAATFDDEPDHGLRDPATRAAWELLVGDLLGDLPGSESGPGPTLRVADLGCGTGSLALLLAARGHEVTGLDASPAMLELAATKCASAGVDVRFVEGDAADPGLPAESFDVVLSRHVLWAMPEPAQAVSRWTDLLCPGGRLLLVEGFWHTGAGLHREQVLELLDPRLELHGTGRLDDPALWGGVITDERFYVAADRR